MMARPRIGTIAITGIAIVTAGLLTLSTTEASAATTTVSAPSHATNPKAAEYTGCVADQFGIWDEDTYEQCVRDLQILLNDLYDIGRPGPNQRLTVDGYYGPDTESDVYAFQLIGYYGGPIDHDGIAGPQTWDELCQDDEDNGFRGAYFQDAGCPQVISP
ncbi:MAG TPA: peptidoglycan-binding domain-containing protein [Streptosporangiaceae bacterium]|jgi:peptidoglycan hydrolase-like protein with peptidoglycan-binding domain